MAGSIFAKMRKEAKKQNTVTESPAAKKIAEESKEVTPLTEEELALLLNAATEGAKEEIQETVSQSTEQTTKEVIKTEDTNKYFTAVGLYYDQSKRKFMKVIIAYDPQTNFSKIENIEEYADSAATAIFKINNHFAMKMVRESDVL